MLVVDEAFSQAGFLCHGCFELYAHEAISLIETMVPEDQLLRTLGGESDSWDPEEDKRRLRHTVLHINLLDPVLFAKHIQEYGYNMGYLKAGVQVGLAAAELCMARVMSMASETWPDVRAVLLQHCTNSRPSKLQSDSIHALAIAMGGIPAERFAVCPTGAELMSLRMEEQRSALGCSSSVLLLRFRIYQKMLHLLEGWYSTGSRLTDTYTGLGAWGLIDRGCDTDSDSRSTDSRLVAQCVEVCPYPKLLLALMTLNRAMGAGLNSHDLSTVAARTAGLTGMLLRWSSYDVDTVRDKGIAPSAIKATCRWVLLGDLPFPNSLVSVLMDCEFIRLRVPSDGASNGYGDDEELYKVELLTPFGCLRALYEDPSSVNLCPTLDNQAYADDAMATASTVKVGCLVRIDPVASLQSACQRFDWWDRPPKSGLQSMSGCIAIVVSVKEAYTKHRAGVRVLYTSQGKEYGGPLLADALPIECLTHAAKPEKEVPAPEEEEAAMIHASVEVEKRKKKKKAKKSAGAARRSLGHKKKSESTATDSIDPSTIVTTESFKLVEKNGSPLQTGASRPEVDVDTDTDAKPTSAGAGANIELNSPRGQQTVSINIQRCKCKDFYIYGTCEHISSQGKALSRFEVHTPVEGASVDSAKSKERRLGNSPSQPVVTFTFKNSTSHANVIEFAGAEHYDNQWSDPYAKNGKNLPVLLSAKAIAGSPRKKSKITGGTSKQVKKAMLSAFSWIKPIERKTLEQIWEEGEEAYRNKQQDENGELEDPLQFLAVDGRKYESFGIYRLQGRTSVLAERKVKIREPVSQIAAISNNVNSKETPEAGEIVVSKTGEDFSKLEYSNILADEDLIDGFMLRASSDPLLLAKQLEESDMAPEITLSDQKVSPMKTISATRRDESSENDGKFSQKLDNLLQTVLESETICAQHAAKEHLLKEIADAEEEIRAAEDGVLRVAPGSFTGELDRSLETPQGKQRSLKDLLTRATSAESKVFKGITRTPSLNPKDIIIVPKPLNYWQRQAWAAMAEGKPRKFEQIVRNSFRKEKEKETAELERALKEPRSLRTLQYRKSEMSSSLKAGSALPDDVTIENLDQKNGCVVGRNIGRFFKTPSDADDNVLEELQRQRTKGELEDDDKLEGKGDLQSVKKLTLNTTGNVAIPPPGLALYPPLDRIPSDLEEPVPAPNHSYEGENDEQENFGLKVSRTELYLSVMEDVINAQAQVPKVTVAKHQQSEKEEEEAGYFMEWQQILAAAHAAGEEPRPGSPNYSHANVNHRNRKNPAIHRERQSWTQEVPAPNPHPPQFPKRDPFVQPGLAQDIREARPFSGLTPAAQRYTKPENFGGVKQEPLELETLLAMTAMESKPARNQTLPRPLSGNRPTRIPTLPPVYATKESNDALDLSPNVSKQTLNQGATITIDEDLRVIGDRVLSEALLSVPITSLESPSPAPSYQQLQDYQGERLRRQEMERQRRVERTRNALTGGFDFEPLVTALLAAKNDKDEENVQYQEEPVAEPEPTQVVVPQVKKIPGTVVATEWINDIETEEEYQQAKAAPPSQPINIFG